ncbi:MAG: tungstate transport system permease protein [Pirellulaceae bacterium]|jgi:tungstate transport system permease protein
MQDIWHGLYEAFFLLLQLDSSVVDAALRTAFVSSLAVMIATLVGVPIGLLLGQRNFFGRTFLVLTSRAAMGLPTVLIGLTCYCLLSRKGPLGDLQLLYTEPAIIFGEFFLALPIIVTWTHSAYRSLDPAIVETTISFQASWWRRTLTLLSELRSPLLLAILTAFGRCATELGIAMLVGGNLKSTRTLATSTALETSRGEFSRGIAMGLIMLLLAVIVALAIAFFNREEEHPK